MSPFPSHETSSSLPIPSLTLSLPHVTPIFSNPTHVIHWKIILKNQVFWVGEKDTVAKVVVRRGDGVMPEIKISRVLFCSMAIWSFSTYNKGERIVTLFKIKKNNITLDTLMKTFASPTISSPHKQFIDGIGQKKLIFITRGNIYD